MLARIKPDWFPDWTGQCCAIVAAGTSVTQTDVDKLRNRIHVCAINTSYQLCTWADMLYACDSSWWRVHSGAKDFAGLKVSAFAGLQASFDAETQKMFPEIKRVRIAKRIVQRATTKSSDWVHDILIEEPGVIGSGTYSGYQAINLLVQFGVTGILLVGFDCQLDPNGTKIHWHGRHPDHRRGDWQIWNPTARIIEGWREHTTAAAPKLQQLGVEVINCSPYTALQCFPKRTIDETLEGWGL